MWVAIKKMVKDWFNELVADIYDAGILPLITRYKCLHLQGDYVEK
jgi:hypothetical protein